MNITGKSNKPKRDLREFLDTIAVRGECICGKCKNGEHTVDLVFMKVSIDKWTSRAMFRKLVEKEYPQLLTSRARSLFEVTEMMGDREYALITMGIGKLLGVWDLKTPDDVVKNITPQQRLQLAESHVKIWVPRGSKTKPRKSCHVQKVGM